MKQLKRFAVSLDCEYTRHLEKLVWAETEAEAVDDIRANFENGDYDDDPGWDDRLESLDIHVTRQLLKGDPE